MFSNYYKSPPIPPPPHPPNASNLQQYLGFGGRVGRGICSNFQNNYKWGGGCFFPVEGGSARLYASFCSLVKKKTVEINLHYIGGDFSDDSFLDDVTERRHGFPLLPITTSLQKNIEEKLQILKTGKKRYYRLQSYTFRLHVVVASLKSYGELRI